MFDNLKDRFAKLEEDHESVRNVKQHVEKYQVVYATVGGSAITLVAVKLFGKPQVIVHDGGGLPAVINNAPIFNNTVAPVMNNIINNGGHMRKIIRCIETDELWPSMTAAAEAAGVTLEKMSKHLHGYKDHVNELHYVIEGLAA